MPCPYWLALIPPACPAEAAAGDNPQRHAIGCWALQFTPRVALVEEAVLFDIGPSLKLFGGTHILLRRIAGEARELGCRAMATAANAPAALVLARAGGKRGVGQPLPTLLAAVPLRALSAAALHADTLAALGCRTLGDLRRLPRAGLARRFGPALLAALDEVHGEREVGHTWLALPETFSARLVLPGPVDHAAGLLFAARRLLLQMAGWLHARRAGIRHFCLSCHADDRAHDDSSRDSGIRDDTATTSAAGQQRDRLTLRTAEPTADAEHLSRLLSEHLAHFRLTAPVVALTLHAGDTEPLPGHNASLLPRDRPRREALPQLLERLSARLGADHVRQAVPVSEHRPECRQRWHHWLAAEHTEHANRAGTARTPCPTPSFPQPTWLLEPPQPLEVRHDRPCHQGPLRLLAGPQRIEAGWWDEAAPGFIARDYFIADSPHAGLLWIYRERPARHGDEAGWFLHGRFA